MELWIRSQDKTILTQSTELRTIYNGDVNPLLSPFRIVDNKDTGLGIYKSIERALEVLDEIQERILNLQLVECEERGEARKDVKTTPYLECVYEMPSE